MRLMEINDDREAIVEFNNSENGRKGKSKRNVEYVYRLKIVKEIERGQATGVKLTWCKYCADLFKNYIEVMIEQVSLEKVSGS